MLVLGEETGWCQPGHNLSRKQQRGHLSASQTLLTGLHPSSMGWGCVGVAGCEGLNVPRLLVSHSWGHSSNLTCKGRVKTDILRRRSSSQVTEAAASSLRSLRAQLPWRKPRPLCAMDGKKKVYDFSNLVRGRFTVKKMWKILSFWAKLDSCV